MTKRRVLAMLACGVLTAGLLTGCGGSSSDTAGADDAEITVVSREDGSGTRGAFVELFGVQDEDDKGEKTDMTTEDATITSSTEVVMTTVAGNKNAIGYCSLGSLNDTVKAVKIDGVEATVDNINNGKYAISRPFNIATNGTPSEVTQDFINYILSEDGQKIVEENGYIKASDAGAFKSNGAKGKIVVAGSSSVSPVMEKLMEAYKKVNTGADVELQESDSTTGMKNAIAKTCDIGMASRDLKDSETSAGLKATVIAKDGITVVVNKENSIDNLTKDQVNNIYRGKITTWGEVK
ncbi:MAG: substrate-binding domain-containing protein [Eubacterium sp.]|jgi:phosphate transport system substrate-binding protein|nr:phosphate transport system substrate-binding protein [Clostridium sp. CAG:167]